MIRKLYAKYNKRSQQIEAVWVSHNDEQAQYEYSIANLEAEEKNRYYNSNDYNLICLGVLEMEGEECGIKYEYNKDYPYWFEKVKDFQIPKHNAPAFEKADVESEERRNEIIKEAKI